MTAINRRSIRMPIPASTTLATADDLDGVQDGSQNLDVSGSRVLVVQRNDGTAGTVGVDVIETSTDGGSNWAADATLLPLASDDVTGTIVANGALNAAGVEPTVVAIWKGGPYEAPTLMRCSRKSTQNANAAAWVTGAPSVIAIKIG